MLERMFDGVGVETREHWWNSLWGTASRRDVWLRFNAAGPSWEIEVRQAGRSAVGEYGTEERAREVLAEATAAGPGTWRRLTVAR